MPVGVTKELVNVCCLSIQGFILTIPSSTSCRLNLGKVYMYNLQDNYFIVCNNVPIQPTGVIIE